MQPIDHEHFMRRALELTIHAPLRPFAAVIVDPASGETLAEGWNQSQNHPIWHGEIDAIDRLVRRGQAFEARRLTLYTTGEPCAMCQSAILYTGIGTVVYGTSMRYLKSLGWEQIDVPAIEIIQRTPFGRCRLVAGVLQEECDQRFASAFARQNS